MGDAGRDAVDIGLQHDRHDRLLRPPPRPPEAREVAAVTLSRHQQLNLPTRAKVDRLVEQLGIDGMTKDRVSAMCRAWDEQVELFRCRPLEGAYPYL